MANVRFYFDWDWQGADQAFRRAVELGPSSDTPYLEYSEFLSGIGKPEQGLEVARKGREIDPISPNASHLGAYALLLLGRFDEAIGEFTEALAKHPNWTWGHIKIAFTYAENNMFDKALESAAKAEAAMHEGGSPLAHSWLGFVYGVAGKTEKARQGLEGIRAMKAQYIDPLIVGYYHLGLGEKEKLLDCMEQAYLERSPLSAHMGAIQFLCRRVGIGEEPRFKALLKKMAYPV
jgi:tetratricopeptide (TPR) repeat protein